MALSDDQLFQLDRLLERGTGHALDYVHGMLTALVCSPRPVAPRDWLPLVLRGLQSPRQEATGLLLNLQEEIREGLSAGEFQPVLSEVRQEDGEVEVEATDWCRGFAEGMSLHGSEWLENLDSDLADLLYPILALASDAERSAGEAPLVADEDQRDEFTAVIPERVEAIYAYWHGGRGAPACPCGSGEPFPECCGRQGRTLH